MLKECDTLRNEPEKLNQVCKDVNTPIGLGSVHIPAPTAPPWVCGCVPLFLWE